MPKRLVKKRNVNFKNPENIKRKREAENKRFPAKTGGLESLKLA